MRAKSSAQPLNRRRHRRHVLDPSRGASADIRFPNGVAEPLRTRLHDVSLGGVSVVLAAELPGLEVGDTLAGVELALEGQRIRGELLVMHISPSNSIGAICGGFFYPSTDEDLLAMRTVIDSLERSPVPR